MAEQEKNQEQWIFDILGKKYGFTGAKLNKLSNEEESRIRESMKQYWRSHDNQSTEFLVNGAILSCSQGDGFAKLNSSDHGVYTDSSETLALANEGDIKINGSFGICKKMKESFNWKLDGQNKCKMGMSITKWQNVRKVKINGKWTLDTNSCLICSRGGVITPVTSGQEFTLSKSYNKYPKFLNDDGSIDEVIVKKLMIRNIKYMKQDEIDALIILGIYLCVCTDVEKLKKIINCGYTNSNYYLGISDRGLQRTLLENFIFVSSYAEAFCRFSALKRKIAVLHNSKWETYTHGCNVFKNNSNIFNSLVTDLSDIDKNINDMFLNIKVLETIVLAGNLYGGQGEKRVDLQEKVIDVQNDGIVDKIKIYELSYIDGNMRMNLTSHPQLKYVSGSLPGFVPYVNRVYLFSAMSNGAISRMREFINSIIGTIGSKISGTAMMINYGTAVVSLAMANPLFAAISAPVGVSCTLLSTSMGIADTVRADNELEYSKVLAIKAIGECVNMSLLSECVGLYTVYACYDTNQPNDDEGAWNTYEKNYKNKSDIEARAIGYATRDKFISKDKKITTLLGQGYSYSISMLDTNYTIERIKNFNNNMKNIRISGKDGNGNYISPKTISEGEGIEEFREVKNLEELIAYMHKMTVEGEYYLYVLSVIGLDGSGFEGKIIYLYDNGEEKILRNPGRMNVFELFEKWD